MLKIINDNNKEMKKIIHLNLRKNNRDKCTWLQNNVSANIEVDDRIESNFLAFIDDLLIGGAIGFVEYNWYYLDLLYINKEYRNQDVGTNLIKKVEEYAKNKGLVGVRMETWDFQAKGFYEKLGYIKYAELKNHPPGATEYFLKKEL